MEGLTTDNQAEFNRCTKLMKDRYDSVFWFMLDWPVSDITDSLYLWCLLLSGLQDILLRRMRSAYTCLFKSQLLTKTMCLAKFATREPALCPTLFQWSIWVFCVATWCSYNPISDLLYMKMKYKLYILPKGTSCSSTTWCSFCFYHPAVCHDHHASSNSFERFFPLAMLVVI